MSKQSLIIKRTKTKTVFYLLFFGFVSCLFLYAAIGILLKDGYKGNVEIGFSIFIIVLILFGVSRMINPLIKIFSNMPEFKVEQDKLTIYDNPKYNQIMFKDMVGCKIYYMRYSKVIGLYLKNDSAIKGNLSKFKMKAWGIPKYVDKIVILDLEFAKTNHKKFERLINVMIERNGE